ncbi:MAG: SDR family NAD(P)-dependent oxidoreductase [Candidatus Tectomicrobia bacterium]|nr:SDR family NAD(P)-dependent oxidoreductase [Candidatus Tectomicrobia bacterium]
MKIVITGATSGIGAALALHYAQPGVTLGLLGRRQDRLAEVIGRCEAHGADVIAEPLDVRDGAAMRIFAETFVARADGVDLVIANAGVGQPDDLASGDIAPHAQQFEINVIGVLNTLIPFVPQMVRQQQGHLVAIASVAGFRALPGSTTYAASKMAVRTLMEGYGWALQPHGIIVTSINPGFVVSEMTDKNEFKMPFLLSTDDAVGKMARAIQRKRRVYTFPWQMAILARLLPYLPGALLRRAWLSRSLAIVRAI